ncbi:ketoacyl-synt-domain-containing protein [Ceraceosorus guamensis]|uniref:Ketoacyl-synt-domain-containing protein n=1 Tax=Ceraceosorus guamensis TaxID=1522189 RepID=A0A316VXL9_9BASI|nr:ketoacyl-synt-domain-containing protein [Ceraceosorus guamensis]PWN40245.1 ketoacyl-synt-domain-containing protein [Ceraceosorus guamensis]
MMEVKIASDESASAGATATSSRSRISPAPKNLTQFFQTAAQLAPDTPFCRWPTSRALDPSEATFVDITYEQIARLAQHVGTYISKKYNPRVVAIIAPNSPAVVVSFASVTFAGAIFAPVPHNTTHEVMAGMIEVVQADLIIVSSDVRPRLSEALKETAVSFNELYTQALQTPISDAPSSWFSQLATRAADDLMKRRREDADQLGQEATAPGEAASMDSTAVYLFTSAAVTARSLKCASIPHGALTDSTAAQAEAFELGTQPGRHSIVAWAPLSHAMGLCSTLLSWTGASLGSYVFAAPADGIANVPDLSLSDAIALRLRQSQASLLEATPMIVDDVAADPSLTAFLAQRRVKILSAGAPLGVHHIAWAMHQRIHLIDGPGSTEASGYWGSGRNLAEAAQEFPQIARQLQSDIASVSQESLRVIRAVKIRKGLSAHLDESSGELVLIGSSRSLGATGYLNRPTSSLRLVRAPSDGNAGLVEYRTGDICCRVAWETDGEERFAYVCRNDDLIVLQGGEKVSAIDWEHILSAQRGVRRACVVGDAMPREEDGYAAGGPSSALFAIMEMEDQTCRVAAHGRAIQALLAANQNFSPEARIPPANIIILPSGESVPLTPKRSIWRKMVWKTFAGQLQVRAKASLPTAIESRHRKSEGQNYVRQTLHRIASVTFGLNPELDSASSSSNLATTPLSALGLNSLSARKMAALVLEQLDITVQPGTIYACRTLEELCGVIEKMISKPTDTHSPVRTSAKISDGRNVQRVMICGMSCRLPGGIDTIDQLWDRLLNGRASSEAEKRPQERWSNTSLDCVELSSKLHRAHWLRNELCTHFDSWQFGMPAAETDRTPPANRLLLRCALEALENANMKPEDLRGADVGVWMSAQEPSGFKSLLGEMTGKPESVWDRNYAANMADSACAGHISHFFDLRGPAVMTQTACSSSAVALHQARNAILQGECDVALVGAAAIDVWPGGLLALEQCGLLSKAGACLSFSQRADGFSPSEGVGMIVLVAQKYAREHDLHILGSIAASAVRHDGATAGMGTPSAECQEQLTRMNLRSMDVHPGDITAVETHGTGTIIGDGMAS